MRTCQVPLVVIMTLDRQTYRRTDTVFILAQSGLISYQLDTAQLGNVYGYRRAVVNNDVLD